MLRSLQGKLAIGTVRQGRVAKELASLCWKVVKGGAGTSHVQIILCWKGLVQQSFAGSIALKSEKRGRSLRQSDFTAEGYIDC